MRILLGISILVLVAILGTAILIVRHIRVTRRRNRFLRRQHATEEMQSLLPLPSLSNLTPLPARFAAPILPVAPRLAATTIQALEPIQEPSSAVIASTALPSPAMPAVKAGTSTPRRSAITPEVAAGSALNLIAAARKLSRDLPQIRPAAVQPEARKPIIEEEPLRILEFVPASFIPDSAIAHAFPTSPASPAPAASLSDKVLRPMRYAVPAQDDPQVRRPVRSAHPQPAANGASPSHRSDWAYFNKDMGDLSDPLPGRIRDRLRSR